MGICSKDDAYRKRYHAGQCEIKRAGAPRGSVGAECDFRRLSGTENVDGL